MKKENLFILIIICLLLCTTDVYAKINDQQVILEADKAAGGSTSVTCEGKKYADSIQTYCGLPRGLALLINDAYNLLKIGVPIVLIIMGMIDLVKAITSQNEENIKKGWQTVLKRTAVGIGVFFVFYIVQTIVKLLPSQNSKVINCASCLIVGVDEAGSCESSCVGIGAEITE